jgi:hypothetical protein
MPYRPTDPLTDRSREPDELRRLNLEQDSSRRGMMWPWIVGVIAVIIVVTLVYGYPSKLSTAAGTAPLSSSSATTGAAPPIVPRVNPLEATPSLAPETPPPANSSR